VPASLTFPANPVNQATASYLARVARTNTYASICHQGLDDRSGIPWSPLIFAAGGRTICRLPCPTHETGCTV